MDGVRRRVNRSGSMFIPPKISSQVISKSERFMKTDSALYLKDRGILRYMIHSGDIQEARAFLQTSTYATLYSHNIKVRACLDAMSFIQLIEDSNMEEAISFAEKELKKYMKPP